MGQLRKRGKRKRDSDGTLSLRERKFVQALFENKWWSTKAMETAGYSKSTARTQQARLRRRSRVQRAIIQEHVKRGHFVTNEELQMIGMTAKEYDPDLVLSD